MSELEKAVLDKNKRNQPCDSRGQVRKFDERKK